MEEMYCEESSRASCRVISYIIIIYKYTKKK